MPDDQSRGTSFPARSARWCIVYQLVSHMHSYFKLLRRHATKEKTCYFRNSTLYQSLNMSPAVCHKRHLALDSQASSREATPCPCVVLTKVKSVALYAPNSTKNNTSLRHQAFFFLFCTCSAYIVFFHQINALIWASSTSEFILAFSTAYTIHEETKKKCFENFSGSRVIFCLFRCTLQRTVSVFRQLQNSSCRLFINIVRALTARHVST